MNRSIFMRHKQAKIDGIKVDVNIASLIQSLWNANINTYGSCQEKYPGRAWIGFNTSDDMWRFVKLTSNLQDTSWEMCEYACQIMFPNSLFNDIIKVVSKCNLYR